MIRRNVQRYPSMLAYPGLTSATARARLAQWGHNELPRRRARSLLGSAAHALAEPMFLLLVAAAAIYLVLGDIVEALVLAASVVVIIAITVYQERKTERALEALRDLSSPRALVIRDGAEQRIAGREVVVDDLLVVREGDRVPADARLLECADLHVDESLLTGESVPVAKQPGDAERPGPDVERADCLLGHARREGSRRGARRRDRGAQRIRADRTVARRPGRRSHVAADGDAPAGAHARRADAGACASRWSALYGVTRGDWLGGVLAGLTLAMAILPEEFPVVLTVFLALGAWRISRSGVLTRRMPAIETLGAATVLCVDKTGTLTENRMTVRGVDADAAASTIPPDAVGTLPEPFARGRANTRMLASERDPFDPMERAIHALAAAAARTRTGTDARGRAIRCRRSCSPSRTSGGRRRRACDVVAAKGAPESDRRALPTSRTGRDGGRSTPRATWPATGCACSASPGPTVDARRAARRSARLRVRSSSGLVGLADPLRPTVPQAIARVPRRRHPRRDDHRRLSGDRARASPREAGLARPAACSTRAPSSTRWTTTTLARPAARTSTSSRASCPSRSCASSQALQGAAARSSR